MAPSNYDNCIDAMQWNYNHDHVFIRAFKKWYKEEEFDDAQLIDEFLDPNNGYQDSFFIDYLREELHHFDDIHGQKLFNHLRKALSNDTNVENKANQKCQAYDSKNKAAMLVSCYIEEHCYSHDIPMEVIVLCATYFGPLRWPWFFSKAPSKNAQFDIDSFDMLSSNAYHVAEHLYRKQCSKIPITNELLALHVIGVYNHQFPLLTYLIDAYNRFRIETSINQRSYRRPSEICVDAFIKNVCRKGFNTLGVGRSTHDRRSLEDMCIEAIKYFTNWRHLGKALIKTKDSIYLIPNTMRSYQLYTKACFVAVHRYINETSQRMPCQIDVTILPHASLRGRDEDDCEDDDDDLSSYVWDDDEVLADVSRLLQSTNIRYIRKRIYFHINDLSCDLYDAIKTILANGNEAPINPQRCCVLLDTRHLTFFAYQPPPSSNAATFEPLNDRFVNESLFDNSIKYMIPQLSSIGIKEEHLFSLSFHCMAANDVRTYLFIEGFCTRFALSDFEVYLTDFFDCDRTKCKAGYFRDIDNLLKDTRFDEFYNRMVDRKYKVTPKDERANVIVNVPWRFDACHPRAKCEKYITNEYMVFERARDKKRYDKARGEYVYILSSRLTDFQFLKGQKYQFKIKCEKETPQRFAQDEQQITDVKFGITDSGSAVAYAFENGYITDWSQLDSRRKPLRRETIGKWKYGDVIMMEINCAVYSDSCYLSYFVNYKRIQTFDLKIKQFYTRNYYPFIQTQRDNIRFEILFP